jgi:hypothetical protein
MTNTQNAVAVPDAVPDAVLEVEATKPEVKEVKQPVKKSTKTAATSPKKVAKTKAAKPAKAKVKAQPKVKIEAKAQRKAREKWSHAAISKSEKGIPIPPRADDPNGVSGRAKSLKVDESFFIADRVTRDVSPRLSLLHKSTKLRFTVRAMDGGVRVWRIK